MCDNLNWRPLKNFKQIVIASGVATFNAMNLFMMNRSVSSSASFAIAVSKYKQGGQYAIVITKTTASDITVSLPSGSKISGSSNTTFVLAGASGTKYHLQFTHDGTNFVWENVATSSSGGLEIKNIASTPYTLLASDSGKMLMTNADEVTIPLGLEVGFNVSIAQVHATQKIWFNPVIGVIMNNADSHTRTAKQHAVVSLVCVATNVFLLSGYTAS